MLSCPVFLLPDQMDLVRAFYRELNRGDADALIAFYHPDCVVEHVFTGDDGVYEGRGEVRDRWIAELAAFAGALPGGHRIEIHRVAGIETGWGWVRTDWRSVLRPTDVAEAPTLHLAGHSHFWIEDGLIRRHRSVARPTDPDTVAVVPRTSPRHYPERPVIGVGAVVLDDAGRVVLVKRSHEPLAGQWSLPGGMLELGESLEAGTAREIREETGLLVDVGPVIEVFDRILLDEEGRVRYHFVLVDYLCRPREGTLVAGTDVGEVTLANPGELSIYRVTEKVGAVVARGLDLARGHTW